MSTPATTHHHSVFRSTPAENAARDENARVWRKLDPLTPALALALAGIGIVYLVSAAPRPVFAFKQGIYLFAAFIAFSASFLFPYKRLISAGHWIYLAGIVSLAGVAVLGTEINGARSWFTLGPIRVQPSEFMKIALIIFTTQYLTYSNRYKTLTGLGVCLMILGVPFAMVLMQPDLGSATAMLPMFFAMVFVAGARKRHLALIAFAGLLLAVVGYMFVLKGYQKNRLEAWLHPDQYAQSYSYQTDQSRIAIGSGRVTGEGWRKGTHHKLKYLPERHTDFIFAVISEEGGFVMSSIVLLLYLALFARGLHIAKSTADPAGKIIAVGASTLIMSQAMINISVCNGIMPATGIALPLISYGGSSMLATWIAIGLLCNVGARKTFSPSGTDRFSL